mgnify:FL=1
MMHGYVNQKITDIYSQCSADYDVNSPIKITQKIRECAAERSGGHFLFDKIGRRLWHMPRSFYCQERIL